MYNIAVIGATGLVGSKVLEVLERSPLPIANLYLVASKASVGKKINFVEKEHSIISFQDLPKKNIHIAFNAVGSDASSYLIPELLKINGLVVIDKSSESRMKPDVPLIVAGVNEGSIKEEQKLIAVPNCCVIPLVFALQPLHALYGIKRVIISTYQSVSGAGNTQMRKLLQDAQDDLQRGFKSREALNSKLSFNVIPWIGKGEKDGYTGEEIKIAQEVKKLLGQEIKVSVTSVRVPVAIGHSICANVEFKSKICIKKVMGALQTQGCMVSETYITPREAEGKDEVFVSRLRLDTDLDCTMNMWIVADNLLRGAATNAVEVASSLIKRGLVSN